MKKGDIVTIRDGSYTRSIIAGKLIHESLAYGSEGDKKYRVVETECSFPLTDKCQSAMYRNDTVIQAVKSGKVVFIHGRFLKLVAKPVREVTMAEVCTRFGEDVKIKKE